MGHTATNWHKAQNQPCCMLSQNQQILFKQVQTLNSQQLVNFALPQIKSKNVLIVKQISLGFYTIELQSGVFPSSIFSMEEKGLNIFGLCPWNTSKIHNTGLFNFFS